jgi:superfamily I DNA/RNA helicase
MGDLYSAIDYTQQSLDAIDQGLIEPFDCLIIDEGQDLIIPEYLDVFDALLKGGLTGGNWEIYCDLERQALYSDLNAAGISSLLKERANFASFRLRTNCRNTKPIGEETSLLSGFETPPFLPSKIEGLPVDYYFYKNETEKIQKLEKILQQLNHQNISPANITILSPTKFESAGVAKLKSKHFRIHDITKNRTVFVPPDTITFSTIHSFKGLENSFIILMDISRLDNDEFKSFLYVGMSRARVSLCLLLAEQARQDYDILLKKRLG